MPEVCYVEAIECYIGKVRIISTNELGSKRAHKYKGLSKYTSEFCFLTPITYFES